MKHTLNYEVPAKRDWRESWWWSELLVCMWIGGAMMVLMVLLFVDFLLTGAVPRL